MNALPRVNKYLYDPSPIQASLQTACCGHLVILREHDERGTGFVRICCWYRPYDNSILVGINSSKWSRRDSAGLVWMSDIHELLKQLYLDGSHSGDGSLSTLHGYGQFGTLRYCAMPQCSTLPCSLASASRVHQPSCPPGVEEDVGPLLAARNVGDVGVASQS